MGTLVDSGIDVVLIVLSGYSFDCSKLLNQSVSGSHQLIISSSSADHQFIIKRGKGEKRKKENEEKRKRGKEEYMKREKEKKRKRRKGEKWKRGNLLVNQ